MRMRLQSQPRHPASISPPPFAFRHRLHSACDSVERFSGQGISIASEGVGHGASGPAAIPDCASNRRDEVLKQRVDSGRFKRDL